MNVDERFEFNNRQLKLMLIKIEAYETDKLSYHDLIYDLEALCKIMEKFDLDWTSNFLSCWAILEDAYALALSEDREDFNSIEKKYVEEALNKIKILINNKMGVF